MRKSIAGLFFSAFAAFSATQLMATVILPIGLAPGSQYQLIFVTADSIIPGSSNIVDYNAFVAAEAALNPSLPPATWHVVGSTTSINAKVNAPSGGVPVYNTQGIEVASAAGLYTGSLLNPVASDQYGNDSSFFVWTGSTPSGVGYPDFTLGNLHTAVVGVSTLSTGFWMQSSLPHAVLDQEPIYALSNILTLPTPEPATLTLLGSAFLLLGGGRLLRGRRRASTFVWWKLRIEPGGVQELQAALLAIALSVHHHIRSHEADHFEILTEFFGVPDLATLGFEGLTATGLGVDFSETLAPKGFGGVEHLWSPWVGFPGGVQINYCRLAIAVQFDPSPDQSLDSDEGTIIFD
jgi:hypothetical protein